MDDIKSIVAQNIADLRQKNEMTQLELAQKLNYSDKAVSKWERADSIPDITVLKRIADLFEVSLDYLVTIEHDEKKTVYMSENKRKLHNRASITGISVLLVWLLATAAFVITEIVIRNTGVDFQADALFPMHLLSFIYAVPISMIVWLVFNSIWFNRRRNYLIISLLMWSVIGSVYLTLLPVGYNVWQLFVLGIPGQIIIWMWSRLRYRMK